MSLFKIIIFLKNSQFLLLYVELHKTDFYFKDSKYVISTTIKPLWESSFCQTFLLSDA